MTERRLTIIAIVNHFGHWLGIGLTVPILAIFQLDRGASLSQVGLNGLVYAGTVVALEVPTGGLSDAIGRRAVYLVSLVVSMVAFATLVIAQSPLALVAGFALVGTARALSSGSMDAYFIDAFGELPSAGELQRFLGRVGVFVPLSLALGGLAGGMIPVWADRVLPQGGVFDRYSLVFLVVCAVYAAQFVLTCVLIERDSPRVSNGSGAKGLLSFTTVLHESMRIGVADRRVLRLLLGSVVWGVAFAGLEQFWQPFVDGFTVEESPTQVFGFLTMGYFMVGSLGAISANRLFRLIGPRYGTVVGTLRIVMGSLFVVLSFTTGIWGFAAAYLGLFFLNGITNSPEQSMFNALIPAKSRSTLLSFQSLFLQLGGGAAALVWGIVSDNLSIGFSWRVAGVFFGLSSLLYFHTAKPPEAEAPSF